jgi:hypothetical protein
MKTLLPALAILVESGLSLVGLIWVTAMLGFADEAHRSQTASLFGKGLATLCVLTALLPLLTTLWVGWRRVFYDAPWDDVRFGLYWPLMVLLAAGIVCAGLIALFNAYGYTK